MVNGHDKEIIYKRWVAPSPRAVFLLVHGLGAHAGRWETAAEDFLKNGISSYAVELKEPVGPDSTGDGSDHIENYYDKILRLRDIAARDNPGKEIFLIGESLGAIVSFLSVIYRPDLVRGLVCISPAFAARQRPSLLNYMKMLYLKFSDPGRQIPLPFDSSMCTRDTIYREKMDRDNREYRTASVRFILEILGAQAGARLLKRKMVTPALFLVAGGDRIVDSAASEKVFRGLASRDKTLIDFPGMYHSLSIEMGKEQVFEEILRWAGKRLAP